MRKIKKGDEVIVITGKDKGKNGVVLNVLSNGEYLVVEGINLAKKHVRANPNAGERGGVSEKEMPIHCSNVMLRDSATQKGGRVGIKFLDDGRKVRYFKSTNEVIDAQ